MRGNVMRYFWRVAIVHGVLLLVLVVVPALIRLVRRRMAPVVVPIEFLVEVPSAPAPVVHDPPPVVRKPDRPKPDPIPKPEPKPEPEPEPKPERKPRPEIERSTNMVSRTSDTPRPKTPTLTDAQIKEMLAASAKPSDRTSIPGEDARCMDIIRRRLYSAWSQPTGSAGDLRVAEVVLTLGRGGEVSAWSVVKSSGSGEFDRTVKGAVGSVGRIDNLTSSFIDRHPSVTIAFRVE